MGLALIAHMGDETCDFGSVMLEYYSRNAWVVSYVQIRYLGSGVIPHPSLGV